MYAVIFKARIKTFDQAYAEMAQKLRDLALKDYGCLGFDAVTEGDREIAVSYWESRKQIERWRRDPLHQQAQRLGREQWYHSYQVEVAEIANAWEHTAAGGNR